MDPDRRIEELERALSRERAEREAAQRRAAKQAENTAVWRSRAEERTDRIRQLERERDELKSLSGWFRHRAGRLRAAATADDASSRVTERIVTPQPDSPPSPRAWKAFRSTLVATVGVSDRSLLPLLEQFRTVDAVEDAGALDRADLVVLDARGPVHDDVRSVLDRWADVGTGQRLLVIGGVSSPIAGIRNRVDVDVEWETAPLDGPAAWTIPTTFDPDRWAPSTRDSGDITAGLPSSAHLEDLDGSPAIVGEPDLSVPWHVGAAAAGIPFLATEARTPDAVARSSMALRRAVWRDRAPWVVASGLLDRVGIDHTSPLPRVTGILISNRPDRIDAAIRAIARQRYPRFDLLVGCHGIPVDSAGPAVSDVSGRLHVEVVEYPEEMSLGACLNDAIDRARGDVLAKIDDDDHYGPAYIEDAIHAMAYSGAELVSKGAVFTYLESTDTTYLRKPSVVERFHTGSPNGASLVFTRGLWRRIGFPDRTIGEDVALSAAARSFGVLPYATSPWEFVYRRSTSGNTWEAVDDVFTEGSIEAWMGDHPERSEVADL